MGERISITMQDGFELGAYHSAPSGQSKGVVVVIQEIIGVNGHIREVVEGYAERGYHAICFSRRWRNVRIVGVPVSKRICFLLQ